MEESVHPIAPIAGALAFAALVGAAYIVQEAWVHRRALIDTVRRTPHDVLCRFELWLAQFDEASWCEPDEPDHDLLVTHVVDGSGVHTRVEGIHGVAEIEGRYSWEVLVVDDRMVVDLGVCGCSWCEWQRGER